MTNAQTALVTGAATRVGRAFALHLARQGYAIALHYNGSEDPARRTQSEITALGVACELFQHDLANLAGLADLMTRVRAALPNLNVLINCASRYAAAPLADSDPVAVQAQFDVNFFAPLELIRQFCASGSDGSVINILDNKIAYEQYPYAAYLLSKKALAQLTPMAAMEYAPDFRINAIAPGVVLPAAVRSDDYVRWRIDGIPLQRQGAPDHLCQALDYLLANDFVTGQILTVDGGEGAWLEGRHSENYPGP